MVFLFHHLNLDPTDLMRVTWKIVGYRAAYRAMEPEYSLILMDELIPGDTLPPSTRKTRGRPKNVESSRRPQRSHLINLKRRINVEHFMRRGITKENAQEKTIRRIFVSTKIKRRISVFMKIKRRIFDLPPLYFHT